MQTGKVTKVVGGTLGGAFVTIILIRALFDAYGHVGIFLALLPAPLAKFVSSPNGVVFLIVSGFALLLWSGRHPIEQGSDLEALHAANTNLQNEISTLKSQLRARHLSSEEASAIIRTMNTRLGEEAKKWPEDAPTERIKISVISIGRERETLDYRGDFAKAFEAGGFDVDLEEWDAGAPQLEEFVGSVTVLEGDPRNVIRPIVLDALRAAGFAPREAPYPARHRQHAGMLSFVFLSSAVQVVVGQRG